MKKIGILFFVSFFFGSLQGSIHGIADWHKESKHVYVFYCSGKKDSTHYYSALQRLKKRKIKTLLLELWSGNIVDETGFFNNLCFVQDSWGDSVVFCDKHSFKSMNFMYQTVINKRRSFSCKYYDGLRKAFSKETLFRLMRKACSFFEKAREGITSEDDKNNVFENLLRRFVINLGRLSGTMQMIPFFALVSGAIRERMRKNELGSQLNIFKPFVIASVLYKIHKAQGSCALFIRDEFLSDLQEYLKDFGWQCAPNCIYKNRKLYPSEIKQVV